MLDFSNEVALVTGAGQGLGRAYALALAARGAHVVVNDLGDSAHRVVEEISASGGRATAATGSVADDADAIVAEAARISGGLDIVINNAGITGGGAFHQIAAADWDRLIEVQLGGTVNISRAAWPLLMHARHGRLVNTSSASIFGAPFTSHYAASKAAIFSLTRSWAGEGAADGARVNCIMPSAFTPMTAQIPDPEFRSFLAEYFPVEPIAEFMTWLVHRDTAINGETFDVGGGRAARVLLAVAAGVHLPSSNAEAWVDQEGALLSLEGLETPVSMIDEVAFQARHLGSAARVAFEAIERDRNWAD